MKTLLATLALTLLAVPASMAADQLQCGVVATQANGMLVLKPTVVSPTALKGSYELHLTTTGASSSKVNQGGPFVAAAGDKTVLGQLGFGSGTHYKVDFKITAAGKTYDCSALMN